MTRTTTLLSLLLLLLQTTPALATEEMRLTVSGTSSISSETVDTATLLFGDALAVKGFSVASADAPGGRTFAVEMMKLGTTTIVSCAEVTKDGAILYSVQHPLTAIGELYEMAPRMVEAVIARKPLASTATVTSITSYEQTKGSKRIEGEFLFGAGIVGGAFVHSSASPMYGFSLDIGYDLERWNLGLAFAYAWGNDYDYTDDDESISLALSVDYLFSTSAVSPYVGLGIGIGGSELRDPVHGGSTYDDYVSFDGDGLFVRLEGGVELFRTYGIKLFVGGQLDLPLYLCHSYGGEYWSEDEHGSGEWIELPDETTWAPSLLATTTIMF